MGEITAEYLRSILDYEPATGVFTWKTRRNWHVHAGDRAGYESGNGYRKISILGREYLEHRLAWLFVHGVFPEQTIDHANLNGRDNRIDNLRLATGTEQQANRALQKNNRSGVKGVIWLKRERRWQACIHLGGQRIDLGRHLTRDGAATAYRLAAERHYGAFARPARIAEIEKGDANG